MVMLEGLIQITGFLSVVLFPVILSVIGLVNFLKRHFVVQQEKQQDFMNPPETLPHKSNPTPWMIETEDGDPIFEAIKQNPKMLQEPLEQPSEPLEIENLPPLPTEIKEIKSEKVTATPEVTHAKPEKPNSPSPPVQESDMLRTLIENEKPKLNVKLRLPRNQKLTVYDKKWIVERAELEVGQPVASKVNSTEHEETERKNLSNQQLKDLETQADEESWGLNSPEAKRKKREEEETDMEIEN